MATTESSPNTLSSVEGTTLMQSQATSETLRCSQLDEYREVLENNAGHTLPSEVWADALLHMEFNGHLSHSQLLSSYRNALASCPYSVRLWCQLADCQTRAGDPWAAVSDTCEAALNSGLHRQEDLAAVEAKLQACAAAYGVQL